MRRVPYPQYIRRVGAIFESTERFLKNTEVVTTDSGKIDYSGVVLTQVSADDNTMATTKDELHTFIIGETGSGKTRRVILPTIRLMAKSGRSMIISDPKGELYKKTAGSLKNAGYQVYVLNFRNPSRGQRWNPLRLIEKLCRSGDVEERDRGFLMLKDMATILTTKVNSNDDKFWQNEAIKLFIGYAVLIIENSDPGYLTFENISALAKDCEADLSVLDNPSPYESKSSKFKDYILALPRNSIISSNLYGYVIAARDTRKSVMAVFEGMIGEYVNQQSLLDLFAISEFDVEEIGKRSTALFFILPDDSDAMYSIATAFVKQIYSALINLADNNQSGVLDNEVAFILDEFSNFVTIPSVDSMLTAARSRGIIFTLVCQSMEQLKAKYPNGVSEVLMSNCRVWMYLSCRDFEFMKRIQSLAGEYVSPYTGESYPLVSITDLQRLQMGEVLIFNDRCFPLMGFLPDYSQYNFGEASTETTFPERSQLIHRKIINVDDVFLHARLKINRAKATADVEKPRTPAEMSAAGSSLLAHFGTEKNPSVDDDSNDTPEDFIIDDDDDDDDVSLDKELKERLKRKLNDRLHKEDDSHDDNA